MSAQPQVQPHVLAAIDELEAEYDRISWSPDESGGAYVRVEPVVFGERWEPSEGALEVAVAYNYPYAPIYPFYADGTLRRVDGGPHPAALQHVVWRGRQVTQVS